MRTHLESLTHATASARWVGSSQRSIAPSGASVTDRQTRMRTDWVRNLQTWHKLFFKCFQPSWWGSGPPGGRSQRDTTAPRTQWWLSTPTCAWPSLPSAGIARTHACTHTLSGLESPIALNLQSLKSVSQQSGEKWSPWTTEDEESEEVNLAAVLPDMSHCSRKLSCTCRTLPGHFSCKSRGEWVSVRYAHIWSERCCKVFVSTVSGFNIREAAVAATAVPVVTDSNEWL